MSKQKNVEIQNTTIEVGYEYTLAAIMQANPDLSIRKLANALESNYNMLLKKGKMAVPGEIYDPEAINYNAIEDYLRGQLGGPEEWDAIVWEDVLATETSNKAELGDRFKEPGVRVKIRGKNLVYEIKIITTTHIVLLPVDLEKDSQPRVFSHATFMHQSPKEMK